MMTLVRKVVYEAFTDADGNYDLGKILWAKSVLSYIAYGFWLGHTGHPPDPFAYGGGLSALLGGGGAAIGFKHKAERPTAPPPRPPMGRFDDAA